jgi:hypothetical protein
VLSEWGAGKYSNVTLNPPPKWTSPVCTSLHNITLYLHTLHIHPPMKMEQTQCSETSAIKHHTPGNNPKDYTSINSDSFSKYRTHSFLIFWFHFYRRWYLYIVAEEGPLSSSNPDSQAGGSIATNRVFQAGEFKRVGTGREKPTRTKLR